jgi:uncharacterized protein YceK
MKKIIIAMLILTVLITGCGSENNLETTQKDEAKTTQKSSETDSESYCGRGEYVTYNKRDITFGENRDNMRQQSMFLVSSY